MSQESEERLTKRENEKPKMKWDEEEKNEKKDLSERNQMKGWQMKKTLVSSGSVAPPQSKHFYWQTIEKPLRKFIEKQHWQTIEKPLRKLQIIEKSGNEWVCRKSDATYGNKLRQLLSLESSVWQSASSNGALLSKTQNTARERFLRIKF